jgi:hypothetical protein
MLLRALTEMRRVLKAGGVAGVADGDFATWLWEPSSPRLRELQDLFLRAVRHGGGDPHLARHYRQLLLESGFARSEGYGTASSDTQGTASGTRQFAAEVVEQLITTATWRCGLFSLVRWDTPKPRRARPLFRTPDAIAHQRL